MAQRKSLPPRSSRGQRPEQTPQEKAKDDLLYQNIVNRASQQPEQEIKDKKQSHVPQIPIEVQIQLERKRIMNSNIMPFPYSRGYHYFFDLNKFPRLDGSTSYAADIENAFKSTYPQQEKIINAANGLKVKDILNRIYIGLPYSQEHHQSGKNRDKNVCHGYLFANEDRKFVVDRHLQQLKKLFNHLEKLLKSGDIKNFSCIKRDPQLLQLLQEDVKFQVKQALLSKKIKTLEEKKEFMKNYVYLQDMNFFRHSLNQILHNTIAQQTETLTAQRIIRGIDDIHILRDSLRTCQIKQRKKTLKQMFRYERSQKNCLSDETICLLEQKIWKSQDDSFFFRRQIDTGYYEIRVPFVYFNFSNVRLMNICQKILSLRLAFQNESYYFIAKLFWKKAFDRDLLVNRETKPLSRVDYQRSMAKITTQLFQYQEQKVSGKKSITYPLMDNHLNLQPLQDNPKSFQLFSLSKSIEVSVRQYILLALFQQLYYSVLQLEDFITGHENLIELIASENFNKAQHFIVYCTNSVQVGLLEEVLKRICEWVVRSDFQAEFKLQWVFNTEGGFGYLVKVSLEPQWETEKQQSENDHDNIDEDDDNQQIEESVSKRSK